MKVENLSFGFVPNRNKFTTEIQVGSLTFLLGPNGSGKTTLLKTLAGLLSPLEGRGHLERSLFLPTHSEVNEWVTGEDVFDIFGTSRWQDDQDIQDLEIDSCLKAPLHHLSLGERKRIFLGATLRSGPSVLILDEPLNGLDWNMESRLLQIFKRHQSRGRTLLISAHQLQWINKFQNCQVWFLKEFSVLCQGPFEKVMTSTEVQKLFNFRVSFTDNPLDGSRLLITGDLSST